MLFKEYWVIIFSFFITVHIFFDDAFEPRKSKTGKPMKGIKVNEYVKTLENVIPNTAK